MIQLGHKVNFTLLSNTRNYVLSMHVFKAEIGTEQFCWQVTSSHHIALYTNDIAMIINCC